MKASCCGAGAIGMVFGAIGKVIEILVSFIVYTGLYWPMFYLVVVLGLWLGGGMTFEPSVELTLFYVGLAISLACSLVLTLRHLIFEPFGRWLDERAERREERRASRDYRRSKRKSQRRDDRADDESPMRRDSGYPRRGEVYSRPPRRERPLVYRSRQDASLIIYEYRDRFEVYRETPRGLRHIDTKGKRRG